MVYPIKLEHFQPWEFECHCGYCGLGFKDMNPQFLRRLDLAREYADVKFNLSSAIRCPEHNREVGGVTDSAHLRGYAVDIKIFNSPHRYRVIYGLYRAGFNRVGLYRHLPNLIHVDTDPTKAPNVIWFNRRRK